MKITSILSKQTIFFLIGFISLSALFLPLTSLQALTITDGMAASYVLGQSGFGITGVTTTAVNQSMFQSVNQMVVDPEDDYLFVAESDNNRVTVFDTSGGITNGMNASYVLGQVDFVTATSTFGQQNIMSSVRGVAYDEGNDYLFASDGGSNRVLVFDVSGGITNGMNASYVLGQVDFTGRGTGYAATTTPQPGGLAYDNTNDRLFVGQGGRVTIFDLSGGISNGMAASYVLGQENFTANATGTVAADNFSANGLIPNLAYDPDDDYLYVPDSGNGRILVFDVSSPVNGMNASYVLGRSDFTTGGMVTPPLSASKMLPTSASIDSANNLLFASDSFGRNLVFDISSITNGEDAINVIGQADFTSFSMGSNQVSSTTMSIPYANYYDADNDRLYTSSSNGESTFWVLVFEGSSPSPSSSNSGWSYTKPPVCEASFSPSTITQGESTTLSWNITWPTNKQGTYYTRVPGKEGGLFSHNVSSIQMSPQHSQSITMYTFNLWGANPCTAELEVLDTNGQEITSETNANLTAGASNNPFVKAIMNFFKGMFTN